MEKEQFEKVLKNIMDKDYVSFENTLDIIMKDKLEKEINRIENETSQNIFNIINKEE